MQPEINFVTVDGFSFYILRDDLLGEFNGNKARKLWYFLCTDLSNYDTLISFGSSQSNAMYSESVFCKKKGLKFKFVVDHLNSYLEQNPIGNYKFALENGMQMYVSKNRRDFAKSLCDERTIFIEEGVAQDKAGLGFMQQACVINDYCKKHNKIFDIFLPSGTGASAAFLAKYIDLDVYTCPCVADRHYLKYEISLLDNTSSVKILDPIKKFHFAKPYLKLYEIWEKSCRESGIQFDLIYDPIGLSTMLANRNIFKNEVLYIHQGGILGNISQMERYKHKFGI